MVWEKFQFKVKVGECNRFAGTQCIVKEEVANDEIRKKFIMTIFRNLLMTIFGFIKLLKKTFGFDEMTNFRKLF